MLCRILRNASLARYFFQFIRYLIRTIESGLGFYGKALLRQRS
jgi:hypothetical protein